MRPASAVLLTSLVLLAGAAAAGATNTTLKSTIDGWSLRLGNDAKAVALDARQRHPHRMTAAAIHFRQDAARARAATAAQHPSTAKGKQARLLALAAYRLYALAGSRWAASGRARIARQPQAVTLARAGAAYAGTANTLLVKAGSLLR